MCLKPFCTVQLFDDASRDTRDLDRCFESTNAIHLVGPDVRKQGDTPRITGDIDRRWVASAPIDKVD